LTLSIVLRDRYYYFSYLWTRKLKVNVIKQSAQGLTAGSEKGRIQVQENLTPEPKLLNHVPIKKSVSKIYK
jgi:hypothetical protein